MRPTVTCAPSCHISCVKNKAVPAAGVILENVVAFEVARAFVEKFGGDSLAEVRMNYESFMAAAGKLPLQSRSGF